MWNIDEFKLKDVEVLMICARKAGNMRDTQKRKYGK